MEIERKRATERERERERWREKKERNRDRDRRNILTCVLFGPIWNMLLTLATKRSCLTKSGFHMEFELSRRKTTSAGVLPQNRTGRTHTHTQT